MNDIIKNLADQGKNAIAEWVKNCVDILVKNFACMSSAFLAKADTGHNSQFPCKQKLELSWISGGCSNVPTWVYFGEF